MSTPPDNQRGLPPAFDFDQFLQNQAQELAIRREEIELKREEGYNNLTYAEKALDANLVDRQREREFQRGNNVRGAIVFCLFILLLAFGIGYALYLNKDVLVIELAKYIGLLFAGGVSGYSIRLIKEKKDDTK